MNGIIMLIKQTFCECSELPVKVGVGSLEIYVLMVICYCKSLRNDIFQEFPSYWFIVKITKIWYRFLLIDFLFRKETTDHTSPFNQKINIETISFTFSRNLIRLIWSICFVFIIWSYKVHRKIQKLLNKLVEYVYISLHCSFQERGTIWIHKRYVMNDMHCS